RLRYLDDVMPKNVTTLYSDRHNILEWISRADLLIGAVLIPGARAPHLVRRADLKLMPHRAVIIDVAIDQGGCIETSRPTTHSQPTYIVDDVVHYCVTNMPGAVGRTSTYALTNVTLPYVLLLARKGYEQAIAESQALRHGVNVHQGKVTNPAVAEAFGLECVAAGGGGVSGRAPVEEQQGFLQAIIEQPEDDPHRLVFADWLDERGHRSWAQLIRGQCALARLLDDPNDPFSPPGSIELMSL